MTRLHAPSCGDRHEAGLAVLGDRWRERIDRTLASDRIGPEGHVLMTDIDPRFLAEKGHGNLDVRRHDVGVGPLPDTGLVNLEADAHFEFRRGGSPGARLDKANLCQVRDQLLGERLLTSEELDHLLQLLEDPDFVVASPSCSARGDSNSGPNLPLRLTPTARQGDQREGDSSNLCPQPVP